MRIIILADSGPESKHWVEIDGEPLLLRTIRQLHERGHEDIYITSHSTKYDIDRTTRYEPVKQTISTDIFLATKNIWGYETVILYGDVYYSDDALDTILNSEIDGYAFFGRYAKNKVKPWGEMFAMRFTDSDFYYQSCVDVSALVKAGKMKRGASWELYRYMVGLPWDKHRVSKKFVEINDETDDFDKETDIINWLKIYRHGK